LVSLCARSEAVWGAPGATLTGVPAYRPPRDDAPMETPIEIRFHSRRGTSPVGLLSGEAARQLAFPQRTLADVIEHEGRGWRFHHTDVLSDAGGTERVERLVYQEDDTRTTFCSTRSASADG